MRLPKETTKTIFCGISFFLLLSCHLASYAQKVCIAPVPANSLRYDPVSKKFYASVGSRGRGALANSITRIDPLSGKVEKSVFVGSEPRQLTLSDKSKYLYVVVGGHNIRRLDLDTMTVGPQFPIGEGFEVGGIMPLPGVPEGVLATRYTPGVSPAGNHLVAFVEGKQQALTAACGNCLNFGIYPSRIYTYQNMISSWDFTTFQTSRDGVMGLSNTGNVMSGFVNFAGNLNGLLISSTGDVLDPEARQKIGSLPDTGRDIQIATDPERGLVFLLTGDKNTLKIVTYDVYTYLKIAEMPLGNIGVDAGVGEFMRWGEDGFAFRDPETIYFLRTRLGAKLPSIDLSVKRSTLPLPLPRQQQVRYSLTVTNNSQGKASGVFLTELLPEGVDMLDVKASQGNAVFSGGIVRAEFGALPGQAKATVTITLQTGTPRGMGFSAVVRGQEPDPITANNLTVLPLAGATANAADLVATWDGLQQATQGAGINLRAGIVGRLIVRNQGKQTSRPCLVRFYLANTPNLIVQRSQLLQEVQIPALIPRETYNVLLQAPLGQGDDATGLFVFGVIDPTNTMDEAEKGNNTARARIP